MPHADGPDYHLADPNLARAQRNDGPPRFDTAAKKVNHCTRPAEYALGPPLPFNLPCHPRPLQKVETEIEGGTLTYPLLPLIWSRKLKRRRPHIDREPPLRAPQPLELVLPWEATSFPFAARRSPTPIRNTVMRIEPG